MNINELAKTAYDAALLRGHYQNETGITGRLAFIHRDVDRSLDAHYEREPDIHPGSGQGRPSGPMAHIADAAIRTMTLSHSLGADLGKAVRTKLSAVPDHDEDQLARAAWNRYAEQDGAPDAARYEEMMWDGHARVATHGGRLAREVLNLEGFGVRPQPGDGRDWASLANEAAEIFCWTLAAGYQNEVSMPRLIADVIAHDITRSPEAPET